MKGLPVRQTVVLFPLVIALAACSPQASPSPEASESVAAVIDGPTAAPGFSLSDARVQLPAVPGRPGVAYFTLSASGGAKGALVAVHVDHFARAEMHESKMEGGMMTMDPVKSVDIAPGKPVTFAPGGYHVMLFDGDGGLKAGDTVELTATLDSGDKITAQAKVAGAGDDMGGKTM